jgi:hypothetical protein
MFYIICVHLIFICGKNLPWKGNERFEGGKFFISEPAVFERAVCLLLGLSENLSECRRVGL